MKKYRKIFLRSVVILIGLIFILYFILIGYVSANKKSLIGEVTEELSKKINGNVAIGDIELSFFRTFPRISVLLNEVVITDSMFATHRHTFFKAEEVYAQVSAAQLIQKNIRINGFKIVNADIFLFTDSTGYTNQYLVKPERDSTRPSPPPGNEDMIRSVNLKNVNLTISNEVKANLYKVLLNKLQTNIDNNPDILRLDIKADLLIHGLAFNLPKGSFLTEKTFEGNFELKYIKPLQQLRADSILVKIDNHPYNITAQFDLKSEQPLFDLKISVKGISFTSIKNVVTPHISDALSIVDMNNKIDAKASINGHLNGGDPLIIADWAVRNSMLTTPFLDFEKASFTGNYTNEIDTALARKDPNSKIEIHNFSAEWKGLPVTSKSIEIMNLLQPQLTADLQSTFPLSTLNNLVGSNTIELKEGNGEASLTYKGPVVRNKNTNSFVNGTIAFSDGVIDYKPRGVELKNVNGKLIFKNSDVIVENLKCMVLNNSITMNGKADNLLTLMNSEANKVIIDWNVYSPALNMASFVYLLQPGKQIKRKNKKTRLGNISEKIDDILDKGRVRLKLKTDQLKYKKFTATNVNANVSLLPEKYEIHEVSMNHGGGNINLSGSLMNRNSNYHQVVFKSNLQYVDVNKIFTAFDNFGQNGIEAKNLAGKLTATASGTFGLDNEGKPYPGSVASEVNFSLKNGALNDYEPLKKIQNYIFKNRDFENITFAELKDKLVIANEEITINRMEIASSVFTVFVEGVYSMRGNTDLSIQIPLKNLKKRSADFKPENSGTDKKTGTSVYLRGRPGSDGNIQFKADLFNRFNRSKNKDDSK